MPADTFPCFLVTKDGDGTVTARVEEKGIDDLPAGDVLIRVAFSSLNYKDAMAARGHPGLVRRFPHVPGIDAAGTVVASNAPEFSTGGQVLVTGYELGASHWGGWAGYIRVPAEWVVPLPAGLSQQEAMSLGTAGFTAAQCAQSLQHHGVTPEAGPVVVTGASGGVGSLAVAILAGIGYQVIGSTGKPAAGELLNQIGADGVVGREEVCDQTASKNPLLPARWAGAVDTVGGNTLATLIRSTRHRGCVAACGLVSGADLSLTVYPFLLRGVKLDGIDSAACPMPDRLAIWDRLSGDWKPDCLELITTTIELPDLPGKIDQILAGQVTGRVVVRNV